MMKKFAVIVAVLALAAAALGCGGGEKLPEGAVAKVGDTVILKTTLDSRIADIQAQAPGQTPDPEKDPEGFKTFQGQIVEYLVTLEIATQKAKDLGVTVTDEDVQAQLDQLKGMFGGDEAAFTEALKQQNMTLDQLMVSLRERELLNKTAEAATKDATVPDEEIAAYYEEHKAEVETRTARHILFAPGAADSTAEPTDADWEAARVEAEAARKKITEGADFATLASELSDDTASKTQGGDLGEVRRGVMVPEFEEALFGLKVGEVSQPVKTQFGYHLIKVEQVNDTLDQLKEQIKTTLLEGAQTAAWSTWLTEAKDSLGVVIADDYVVTTTTTGAAGETTTTAAGETTTTAASDTTTTAAEATTTTVKQ